MANRLAPVRFCGRGKWRQNGAKMDQNWTEIDAFLKAKRLATVEFRWFRPEM